MENIFVNLIIALILVIVSWIKIDQISINKKIDNLPCHTKSDCNDKLKLSILEHLKK